MILIGQAHMPMLKPFLVVFVHALDILLMLMLQVYNLIPPSPAVACLFMCWFCLFVCLYADVQTSSFILFILLMPILQVYNLIPPSPAVATFIQSLAPLNSAANPLIYCLFSANIGPFFFLFLIVIQIIHAGKCLQRLWCRRHCPCCSTPDDDLLGSAGLRTTSTGSTLLSRFYIPFLLVIIIVLLLLILLGFSFFSSFFSSSSPSSSPPTVTQAVLCLDLPSTLGKLLRTRIPSHRSVRHQLRRIGDPLSLSW